MINTVGELKKLLEDLDDNTIIVCYESSMERCGYRKGVFVRKEKRSVREYSTQDAFDGTSYTYEIYVSDSNGEEVLSLG